MAEKNATVVIEREYNTARQCMNPLEGKGTLSFWDEKAGQLVVYTSTQVPHLIRTGIAQYLQMDQGQVRVIAPDVGGGFGYKCVLQPEELSVSWVALKLKRPVRWVEDRREHLIAGANTRQHHYKLKAYADDRGKLLGIDAEITVDIGAYSVWPFTACLEAAQAGGNLPGPYALKGYRCKTYSVATNKPGFTPYRGVARPGVCFAMELTIDAIARAVGREAADVRRENLVPGSAMPYTNVTGKFYDSGDYQNSVSEATKAIGLEAFRKRQKEARTQGRFLGLGFGTFTEQSAHGTKVFASWGLPLVPGYEQAMVKLTPSGSVEVRSGNHSFGFWGERFQYGKLDEKHAKMTHEEANWRLILTQPSGYSNSFSSGNEGKATRDDLHRKDWDGSSRRAGPAAVPPHLSPLLEVGHSWTRKVSHR